LPSVNRLYEKMKGRGLAMFLVDFREGHDVVKRAVQEHKYTAPVLLDESGDVTGRLYGVWGPPTVYFIDRAGRLVGRGVGPLDWHTPVAERFLDALLAAPAPR
jgi:hypothetical protein